MNLINQISIIQQLHKNYSPTETNMINQFPIIANYFSLQFSNFSAFQFTQNNLFLQSSFQMVSEHPSVNFVKVEEPIEKGEQNQNRGLKCESEEQNGGKKIVAQQQYEKERDRNMISNSMKVFRKFLKDSSELCDSPIKLIIQQKSLNYSAEQFTRDIDVFIPPQKNYYGAKFLKSLISNEAANQNFKIIVRILINYFCRKLVFPTVLTSSKILKDCRKRQLIGARKILQSCKF